jgi:hypothetical protein
MQRGTYEHSSVHGLCVKLWQLWYVREHMAQYGAE